MTDESPKHVPDIIEAHYGIDEEITKRIRKQAAGFITLFQRSVAEGWEIGKELTEAKPVVAHGYWIPWVEAEVGLSRRTAQRLMDLYARDPEKRHVTLFESTSEALRLLPPAESKSKDGRAGASGGKTASPKAKGTASRTAEEDLGIGIARLEPILGRIGRSRRRQREADLQALLKLTVLAVTAVDSQLKLPAGDHESAVGFSGEVVEKLRAVLETATKSQQDEQIKLM